MYKSGIIEIFKTFSKEEMGEFRNFIHSPFFNRSQSIMKLFDRLKIYYPEFNSPELERRKIFKDTFGKAEYNEGLLRVLSSNLAKLAKEYLTYFHYRNNRLNQKLFLLDELNNRKLEKQFKITRKETESYIKTLPKTDMLYFLNKSFLDDNIYLYNQWRKGSSKKKLKIQDDEYLKNIMDDITRYYLIASLMMIRKIIFSNKSEKLELTFPFSRDILKVLESRIGEFSDAPVISLHLYEILLLTKGGIKYFKPLKDIFIKESGKYDIFINFSLHRVLQKYIDNQILNGKYSYKKEKLGLYKAATDNNILRNPLVKYFEPTTFLSVVNEAAELKELSWANKFMDEYRKYLDPALKEDIMGISNSLVLFSVNEYRQALNLLKKVKTRKSEILLREKILLLKIYFELDMYIEAYMVIDTFRHLLSKADKYLSPQEILIGYKNFLKYYSVLIKARERHQPELLSEVKEELKKVSAITERYWLTNKIKEIIS